MSETALPKDDVQPAPEVVNEPPLSPPKRAGNGLAVCALLVAAVGLAAGGWGVWQVRSLIAGHQQQSARLEALSSENRQLQQSEQQLSAQLEKLPPPDELEARRRLVAQLQGDQQRLGQRLESVLGASRKDWRLAEAEHLLRLASLRLSALQDITSAAALVEGADEILREQDDPGAFAAREQLAKSLAALRSTRQPDRTGLYLKLGALREQSAQLTALAPQFQSEGELARAQADSAQSRWRQWADKIGSYFRVDFNPDDSVRPLLAGQGLNQVRLALNLALEQAQWAALNGQAQVYGQALSQARGILVGSFNQDNEQSAGVLAQLKALEGQPVSVVTPDLAASLGAVQAYLERRHAPDPGLQAEPAQEPNP